MSATNGSDEHPHNNKGVRAVSASREGRGGEGIMG
jgi:hypothetical protein